MAAEPVGAAEARATEGAAGLGIEDGEAGVGDPSATVAVELEGEVGRLVQPPLYADRPPAAEGARDPLLLLGAHRVAIHMEQSATGA